VATGAYVDAVFYWAPDLAAELATTLDAGFREEKLKQCLGRWKQLDGKAATKWEKQMNAQAGKQ